MENGKKKWSAKERRAAEQVHRTHLLCLFARGQMHDCAADDPAVQARTSMNIYIYIYMEKIQINSNTK